MNTERLLQGANLWLHIYKSSHSSGKKKTLENETKMNAYQYEQKRKQWWRRENAHDPKHNPPAVKHVKWLFTANAILTCTACITVCSITYWLIDLYCNKIIIQWLIDLYFWKLKWYSRRFSTSSRSKNSIQTRSHNPTARQWQRQKECNDLIMKKETQILGHIFAYVSNYKCFFLDFYCISFMPQTQSRWIKVVNMVLRHMLKWSTFIKWTIPPNPI